MCGPPAWGLGEALTSHRKNYVKNHSKGPWTWADALVHGIVVSHISVGMVTGCVLCPVRTEAEEIIAHRTCDTRQ
jgi:hypothetical protein